MTGQHLSLYPITIYKKSSNHDDQLSNHEVKQSAEIALTFEPTHSLHVSDMSQQYHEIIPSLEPLSASIWDSIWVTRQQLTYS